MSEKIMKINMKRMAGEKLERGGISQRIIQIATEIAEGTYKEAIEKAGQISVLVDAASYDEYWDEKAKKGQQLETDILSDFLDGNLKRDDVVCRVNPYETR